MNKTKRISDQILILQSIAIVRDELTTVDPSDPKAMSEVMERLVSLYACLNPEQVVNALKQQDIRGEHGE